MKTYISSSSPVFAITPSQYSVMGVLNVTPNSFSDGGKYLDPTKALLQAEKMIQEGAAIIDVGGEATHPGAAIVSVQEQLDRVIPIIEKIHAEFEIPLSVDTSEPLVMQEAIKAGVSMVNDIRALQVPGALEVVAETSVSLCLMHMKGSPQTMQVNPTYQDVVTEVKDFLLARANACQAKGIQKERLILDPGFGFGKDLTHNLTLLKNLQEFTHLGYPILIGLSRKKMIGTILDKTPEHRLYGSLAAAVIAYEKGASILRVHDVGATVDALKLVKAVHCV